MMSTLTYPLHDPEMRYVVPLVISPPLSLPNAEASIDASARWPTLQPPLLWLAYPRDHMAGVSLGAARAEFAAVKAAQGPASRSKFVEVSVTGEEAHCRMCEAPDEYVGELMAFVRGVAADS